VKRPINGAIDLQINLLAEKEITKVIQLLQQRPAASCPADQL
jgi:hypothetical protein